MNRALILVLTLACAAVLYFGLTHWNNEAVFTSKEKQSLTPAAKAESPAPSGSVETLATNWPAAAQKNLLKHQKDGEPFHLAIVGSPAMGKEDNGWGPTLKAKVEETYKDLVNVTLYEYDLSSIEFSQGDAMEEVLNGSPDLVLYEPFSLINNTVGVPEDQNEETILTFQDELKKANEHTTLLLQPSYPIVGATYYPRDIKELKAFAKEQDIPYLDHWEAWPKDDELEDYLVEDQDGPNEKGNEVWGEYLAEYFIH